MSNKTAISEFADTMLRRFPPYRQWEEYQEKAWADDLVAELSGFSVEVIKQAQRQIIRSRKPKDPRPPMISECIEACAEARRFIETDNKAAQLLPEFQSESVGALWTPERIRFARENLMTSEMAKQAAREGWILELWHHCVETQRLPSNKTKCARPTHGHEKHNEHFTEIECMKQAARFVCEMYETGIRNGLDHPFRDWLENMRERRERETRRALGQ